MLENCPDLFSADGILRAALPRVELIGDLPLSPDDVRRLAGLLRQHIERQEQSGQLNLPGVSGSNLASYPYRRVGWEKVLLNLLDITENSLASLHRVSLACFLVHQGILSYGKDGYWPAVE